MTEYDYKKKWAELSRRMDALYLLHSPMPGGDPSANERYCRHCYGTGSLLVLWPCPTMAIVDGDY
jgi:hypothetical protein